jgi:predicted thioesterase
VSEPSPPRRGAKSFDVTDDDTALALGSGDVPVLATPRLIAWLEAATCVAAAASGYTGDGRTSVGTRVVVDHLSATPVGGRIDVVADLVEAEGRVLRFAVTATDRSRRVVATGEVTRAVVDVERFVARLGSGS